jgi:hypothetical protein
MTVKGKQSMDPELGGSYFEKWISHLAYENENILNYGGQIIGQQNARDEYARDEGRIQKRIARS